MRDENLFSFILRIILKLKKISNKWSGSGNGLTRYLETKKFNRATNWRKQVQFLRSASRNPASFIERRNAARSAHFICRFSLVWWRRWLETGCLENRRAKIEKNYFDPRAGNENGKNEVGWSCSRSRGCIWPGERRLLRRRDLYRGDALTSMLKSSIFNARQRVDRTR